MGPTVGPTVVQTFGIGAPESLVALIDDFVHERGELTALDLYYELERATPLLGFHTMLRPGERNRARSGLQQSYGDHNRLLMLGLDRLLAGDLEWFRHRLADDAGLGDDALRGCLETAVSVQPPRDVVVALWLAAALHDCGMLCRRGASVDVEDGVVVSRDVIDALCPGPLRGLATTVLHHHDYIKGVFLGEVPAALVAADIERLDAALRPVALAGLGFVQVAGAASLGEGRLDAFRVDVFHRCLSGDALDDRSSLTRLARLLAADESAARPSTDDASVRLEHVASAARAPLDALLASASLHAWQRVTRSLRPDARFELLQSIADRFAEDDSDHVVLEAPAEDVGCLDHRAARIRTDTASSGVRLLLIEW